MSGAGAGIAGGQGQQSMAALELLAHPGKLQARIASFKAAEEAAREQIALAGPASEIVQIRGEIDALKEEAQKLLDDAMNEADEIVAAAGTTASEMVADAEADASSIAQATAEAVERAEARVSGIKTHETAVQRQIEVANLRAAELDRVESTLQQKADDLGTREQELDGEREKLAEVRELINHTLLR